MNTKDLTDKEAIKILQDSKSLVVGQAYGLHDAVEKAVSAIENHATIEDFINELSGRLTTYGRHRGVNKTLDDVFQILNATRRAYERGDLSTGTDQARIKDWLSDNLRDMILDGKSTFEMDLAENELLAVEPIPQAPHTISYLYQIARFDDKWGSFVNGKYLMNECFTGFKIISPEGIPDAKTFDELADNVYAAWRIRNNECLGR